MYEFDQENNHQNQQKQDNSCGCNEHNQRMTGYKGADLSDNRSVR